MKANSTPLPTNVRYFLTVMSALERLRQDAREVEAAYLRRLSALFESRQENFASSIHQDQSHPDIGHAPHFAAARKFVARMLQLCLLVPMFVSQWKRLSSWRRQHHSKQLILAIASNRLPPNSSLSSFRLSLATLLWSIGASSDSVSKKIVDTDAVFVFDALHVSAFWSLRDKLNKENVAIIDGAFLAFFYAAQLIVNPLRQLRKIYSLILECYRTRPSDRRFCSETLLKTIFYASVANAYKLLLDASVRSEAVFVTSNAVLTELLRAHLFRSAKCTQLIEILHGAGSIPAERFFAKIIAAGSSLQSSKRLSFVRQVPNLPLYGVFKTQSNDGPPFAINCYLNHYFMEKPERSFAGWIQSEYRTLRGSNAAADDPIIITIFGNCVDDGPLTRSASFRAECALISLITKFGETVQPEYLIVYIPHPTHRHDLLDHPAFTSNHVRTYRKSVFGWLISDLCVALASSTMFEARYFGVPAFTPMLNSDQIYTASYLDQLAHPQSNSFDDLNTTLRNFLAEYRREPHVTVLGRARGRLALMGFDSPLTESTATNRAYRSRESV